MSVGTGVAQAERLARVSEILVELFRSPVPTHFFQTLGDQASMAVPSDYLAVCLQDRENGGYLVHSLAGLDDGAVGQRVQRAERPVEDHEAPEAIPGAGVDQGDLANLPPQRPRPPAPVGRHHHQIMIQGLRVDLQVAAEPDPRLAELAAELLTDRDDVDDRLRDADTHLDTSQQRRHRDDPGAGVQPLAERQVVVGAGQAPLAGDGVVVAVAAVDGVGEPGREPGRVRLGGQRRAYAAGVVEPGVEAGLVAAGRAVQQVAVALEQVHGMAGAGQVDRDGGAVDPGTDDRSPHMPALL